MKKLSILILGAFLAVSCSSMSGKSCDKGSCEKKENCQKCKDGSCDKKKS